MKTFVEFYTWSTGYIAGTIPLQFGKPELIVACGDRAIIQIDSRLSHDNIKTIAENECKKRGFVGYKILTGKSLQHAGEQMNKHKSKVNKPRRIITKREWK